MARVRHAPPTECFAFSWWRGMLEPAFSWKEDPQGRWLLVGPPNESLSPYEPFVKDTALFFTFARLDGSKDAFLRFANTYGRLGTYHTWGPERGEPLDEWQRQHRWLRFLVELRSECVKERPELDHVVSWKGDEVRYRFPRIGTGATETWRHRGELCVRPHSKSGQPLFQPGEFAGPARWFLGHAVEDWLRELEAQGIALAARMVWSETDHRPQLVFGPSSLLGALIGQFAAAVHGVWPFKECAHCHKFFRLAPGVNRANRLTCSLTCKQYLHNGRVARARQLRGEGWNIGQIVRELQVKPQGHKTPVAVVKAWIDRE